MNKVNFQIGQLPYSRKNIIFFLIIKNAVKKTTLENIGINPCFKMKTLCYSKDKWSYSKNFIAGNLL